MQYGISSEEISIILYYFKKLIVNLGAYYVFGRVINNNFIKVRKLEMIICILVMTVLEEFFSIQGGLACGAIVSILILWITFKNFGGNEKNYNISTVAISICISNIVFFLSIIIYGIPSIMLKLHNDFVALIFMSGIYWILLYCIMHIKRFNKGLTFLSKKIKGDFFDVLILNLGAIILFFIEILKNSNFNKKPEFFAELLTLSIIMFLTIQKSFQVYYKQKLLIQELNETKKDLKNKTEEVQKLEQENLNFSKKSHSLAHKQKSLEYKLNQLLLTTEISDEKVLKEQIQKVSKELYSKPRIELDKTGITQIDDMLNFMQSECIKNNIDFNLQLSGNIYHIINNIITEEELEILLADHIKDAIIAIKHTDNVNKSILVRLGKIEDCYGLYIYDSGIEFEKETLENLGKKPSTTHKDEGGTGMGFMNTFDTLRKCKGSLIINEIGKPSKENYTKVIMIKFDNKNEFKVVSYKENNN